MQSVLGHRTRDALSGQCCFRARRVSGHYVHWYVSYLRVFIAAQGTPNVGENLYEVRVQRLDCPQVLAMMIRSLSLHLAIWRHTSHRLFPSSLVQPTCCCTGTQPSQQQELVDIIGSFAQPRMPLSTYVSLRTRSSHATTAD